ncbi:MULTISPECIES: hypothetical protein [unclassified Actinotalea]|uniref:hypothetical protein n=1 Tax=unclassified Actinotalea TaxID=2638618 RepID=UPI0015F4C874|nr:MULTISPECIES: hypothetical protein [unclassified Actinotalea]
MSTSTHICVYFDEGGLDHVCDCGQGAVLVVDEAGIEVLVAMAPADATVTALAPARREELLVSA